MSQRLEWLDFARGASILLVVMFHASTALEEHGAISELYWFASNLFGPIRMPVFFLVSGFLARGLLQKSWPYLLNQRVALLAYLFTIWTVIHFGVAVALPLGQDAPLASLLTSFYRPSSVLWFIWALALYLVVAKIGLSTAPLLAMATSVLLSAAVHSGYLAFESFVHGNVLEFMPFFLFGALYSAPAIRSEALKRRRYVVLSAASYLLLFAVLYEQWVPPGLSGPLALLLAILGVNLGIGASILACRSERLARVPAFLGRNTLAVYVAHYPIVQLLALDSPFAWPSPWLEEVLAVPVVTGAAVILSLLLKAVADRLGAGWLYALPAPARRAAPAAGGQKV